MNNPGWEEWAMRVVELFAGVGGFRIGLEGAPGAEEGCFQVIWANQWEPSTRKQHAAEVYVERWGLEGTEDPLVFRNDGGDVFVNEDISLVEASSIPDHDLLCGGFPCQDYSVAKTLPTAHGISGKKGVLWWEIHRILEARRPRYLLLENVDRLLKSPRSQRGRDFAVMLATLSDLGYLVEWRVIDASEYGFPQRRKRVFVFGEHKGEMSAVRAKMQDEGVLSRSFPIHEIGAIEDFPLCGEDEDLADISDGFNSVKGDSPSPFRNCGVMEGRHVWTAKADVMYEGDRVVLRDVLQTPGKVPDDFILDTESLLRERGWIYHKGGKKEMREGRDGFTYRYSEGPVTFPDALNRASRTIVTGEGGRGASRFKHVIKFRPTKGQTERLGLDGVNHAKIRESIGLKEREWLRRLTPVELERLNGFPDGHTGSASDGRRAFFMGNALVCGLVSRISDSIPQ